MSDRERRLLDIASSVADRAEVDWDQADDGVVTDVVRRLRDVERVMHGFQTIGPAAGAAGDGERGSRPAPRFRWGPIEVFERVGRGSFGDVYRAVDTRLDAEVALKIERPGASSTPAVRAILDEARQMARVRHPNVVAVHGADVHDGRAGFWMDYVRGPTLEEYVSERGALPVAEAARIGCDLCRALSAVHGAGLVHGDVKPGNVILNPDGRVMLADFGAVSDRTRAPADWVRSTPVVTAPEVWSGAAVSPRADVYALGVVLHWMVTTAWPVDGADAAEIASRLERGDRADLGALAPALPGSFREAIESALATDPDERPVGPGALETTLRASVPGDASSPEPGRSRGGTNLPIATSSLVGRRDELDELRRLVGDHRIITLTGTGGSGKTRLALEIGSRALPDFPDGAWLVELADASEADAAPRRVSTVLGTPDAPAAAALTGLAAHLAPRRLLLILDNCEHVRESVAEVVEAIAGACSAVTIVATSREPLGVAGEVLFRVPPLTVPSAEDDPWQACVSSEAARLFVERATAVRRDLALTPDVARAIVSICRRVEGLPLAVELAASRASGLPVEEIARELDGHFGLLERAGRTGSHRHRTLTALIDWSHELLTERQRALLSRLAVFRGGFGVEDAQVVCAGGDLPAELVPELLGELTERCLVELDVRSSRRHRMLETIREYARERLRAAGEEAVTARRHLARYTSVAEAAMDANVPDRAAAIGRLDADHDNLRAALRTALEMGAEDPDDGAADRLAAALGDYWMHGGHWSEGRSWCREVIAHRPETCSAHRAEVLRIAGNLEYMSSSVPDALEYYTASLAMSEATEDRKRAARASMGIAVAAKDLGDLPRAHEALSRSLAIFRDLGDRTGVAQSLGNQALLLRTEGHLEDAYVRLSEAEEHFRALDRQLDVANCLTNRGNIADDLERIEEAAALRTEALALARRLGNRHYEAAALNALAHSAFAAGTLERAREQAEAALAIFRDMDNRGEEAAVLGLLARLSLAEGDIERARVHLRRALHLRIAQGNENTLGSTVWLFGHLALEDGKPEVALRLQAAARAHFVALGNPTYLSRFYDSDAIDARAEAMLDPECAARCRAEGARLTLDGAIRIALAACG